MPGVQWPYKVVPITIQQPAVRTALYFKRPGNSGLLEIYLPVINEWPKLSDVIQSLQAAVEANGFFVNGGKYELPWCEQIPKAREHDKNDDN